MELSHLEQAVGSSACKHYTESPPRLETRPENTHCCCSQRDNRLERGADSVVLLSTVNNLLYPLTHYRPLIGTCQTETPSWKKGNILLLVFNRNYIFFVFLPILGHNLLWITNALWGRLFPCSRWGLRVELNFCCIFLCPCFYSLTVQVQALFFSSTSCSAPCNRQEFGSLDGCCCSNNCCIPILGAGRRGSAHQARPVQSPSAGPGAPESYTLHRASAVHHTQQQQLPCSPPALVLLCSPREAVQLGT